MKKQLLATTALVAAGLMAAAGTANAQAAKASKPTLTIGGWVEGIFGGASQEESNVGDKVGWDSMYDSEFIFRGRATLDNGIRIRTVAELEGETSGDQWDEAYMAVAGSFGEIRVGSDDSAANLMVLGYTPTYAVSVGRNKGKDAGKWVVKPSGHKASTDTDMNVGSENDANMIQYFTPRIQGFQLGASYIPAGEQCAASGGNDATCNSAIAEVTTTAHHGFSVAANFDRKFDKVRVGVAAGYTKMKAAEQGGLIAGDDIGDPQGMVVGASVEYDAFKVAGGYKRMWNRGSLASRGDETLWELGARYTFGKNAVSLTYSDSESPASGTVAGDDKSEALVVSYARTLGPGVRYRLDFIWSDHTGENVATTDDNDGYAVTTSVRVDF